MFAKNTMLVGFGIFSAFIADCITVIPHAMLIVTIKRVSLPIS